MVAFEDAVVSFFVDAADVLGVPKSLAAIYGICFASPEPLSFSEIDERLDISSGSISQGLRVLKSVGALKVDDLEALGAGIPVDRACKIPRSMRTSRYAPDLELRRLIAHWITEHLQNHLDSGRDRLQDIIDAIPSSSRAHGVMRSRLEHLQSWHGRAHALMPVVKAFLKVP